MSLPVVGPAELTVLGQELVLPVPGEVQLPDDVPPLHAGVLEGDLDLGVDLLHRAGVEARLLGRALGLDEVFQVHLPVDPAAGLGLVRERVGEEVHDHPAVGLGGVHLLADRRPRDGLAVLEKDPVLALTHNKSPLAWFLGSLAS